MMAALTIKEISPENEVVLIERNKVLGQKVAISGGGRCNVTTGLTDVKKVLNCYPRGDKFLSYSFYEFGPEKVMNWFEEQGLQLKTEKDLRVFPVSNKGTDVVNLFKDRILAAGGEILQGKQVLDVKKAVAGKSTGGFEIDIKGEPALHADKVIVCVGGQAYRHTGSVGDGYTWAEQFGHTITPLGPSLNAFITEEQWVADLAGVSFAEVMLSAVFEEKTYKFRGPFLFTHKGITGPAVFALSSMIAWKWKQGEAFQLKIDFLPDKNHEELMKFFDMEKVNNPKKNFKSSLDALVPRSLAACILQLLQIPSTKNNAEMSRKEMQQLVETIKGMPLNVVGQAAGEEFVTAGGVNTDEVDNKTMESKICAGLYFAGEILNIDGFTGGFNLQAAWATGRMAGLAAAYCKDKKSSKV